MSLLDANATNPREGGASFTLKHRCTRLIWTIVWSLLGRWTPIPFHSWRRFLVRIFGAKISSTAKIYPGVKIWYPSNLTMNDYSCLGPDVICYSMASVFLDRYALISQRAHICAGTHDIDDKSFPLVVKPIHIGANAWVAAEAFVGPGVTIGDGAVLGARAVTFKDLKPWYVYAGVPAKAIRQRKNNFIS
ncbi:putative colanic acid biosynthesis acetyltransferase [Comamonadaceae bacterium PP-2]